MDEARAVLERLERIDRLERVGTPPGELLEEVRALLTEAEAWVRASRAERAARKRPSNAATMRFPSLL
jgi:hypothetical protein